ncbi:MAG TPA: sensor domain-containing diguanylate cyclase [Mycobacteriales bacterium]|nr:sensor domain-containing diguanylate cyclase [Mycobacteriales bacterium]
MTPAMAKLAREAGISGLREDDLPSLEQIERRRFELWLVSTIVIVGLTASLIVLSLWQPIDIQHWLRLPVVRFGGTAFTVVVCGYLVEKEVALRRLSHRLFDERLLTIALSNRLREISALLDAGRAVNSALELDQVLDAILRGAIELLPAATGSIMLLDDPATGTRLRVAAAHGNATAVGAILPVGNGIAGHVARTREALLINGQASNAIFPGYEPRSSQVESSLCIPLVERDDLLGVLNVSAGVDRQFSEYDLRAVSLFAEHAAAAISKARLYEAQRRQAVELAHRATHDPLTGVPNRSQLEAFVAETLTANEALTLLFVDLDGFKEVNDNQGHQMGDLVLKAVAERITSSVSRDDLVCRLGGDEFAVAMRVAPSSDIAEDVADRILRAVSEPLSVDGVITCVSASIGIAIAGVHGDDFEVLLRAADRALYVAKGAGKNCSAMWEPELRQVQVAPPTNGLSPRLPVQRSDANRIENAV